MLLLKKSHCFLIFWTITFVAIFPDRFILQILKYFCSSLKCCNSCQIKVTFARKEALCYHNMAANVKLMDFFTRRKNCVLKIFRFLCFRWICKFQNFWRHDKHYYILENRFSIVSFESYLVSRRNLAIC